MAIELHDTGGFDDPDSSSDDISITFEVEETGSVPFCLDGVALFRFGILLGLEDSSSDDKVITLWSGPRGPFGCVRSGLRLDCLERVAGIMDVV